MKLVIFGLTISSSWGNGHATLWRGLCRALAASGHHVVFYERDVPYYAGSRDYYDIPGGELVLYADWNDVGARVMLDLASADAAIVTSFCPDAIVATDLVLDCDRPVRCFYDLDTPVTLARLAAGEDPGYIGPSGLADFDLVFSYTGGGALDALRGRLGARHVLPLYGHVDPDIHKPAPPVETYRSDLSYLGTWSADRQEALTDLFIEPARCRPTCRFLIGGAQYPDDFPWASNIFFVRHMPPAEHPAFFASSRMTLNVTRRAMAEMGWCPSGRLFEAAACGAPLLSDHWEGLDAFFTPGEEILLADSAEDTVAALDLDDAELDRIAGRARDRVLSEHTSAHRAEDFLRGLASVKQPARSTAKLGTREEVSV